FSVGSTYLGDVKMELPVHELSYDNIMLVISLIESRGNVSFSQYAKASLGRRVSRSFQKSELDWESYIKRLENDPGFVSRVISEITVNVTEMFRDPLFFRALRELVFPELTRNTEIKTWHAGCSSGEEVFSLAILFNEHDLLDKSLLFGTDLSSAMIEKANNGRVLKRNFPAWKHAYEQAGGKGDFSSYFEPRSESLKLTTHLRKHCLFSCEDLTKAVYEKTFHLVFCRNVFIYFQLGLQDIAASILYKSLIPGGYLC